MFASINQIASAAECVRRGALKANLTTAAIDRDQWFVEAIC